MKKLQEIICLSRNAKNLARYLYGIPAFSKKLEKELEQGKVKQVVVV